MLIGTLGLLVSVERVTEWMPAVLGIAAVVWRWLGGSTLPVLGGLGA